MCTVTYIPIKDVVFLTSNRDEKHWRSDARTPEVYEKTSGRMLFPKDGDAGGTWIAAHQNGNAAVFLNGGFVAHTPAPPYRKSRGLILLDLLDHVTPFNCFLAINLNGIEPFTAVLRDNGHLFECRWDGQHKHHKELNAAKPHIWSSCTLYNTETIAKRNSWFDEWVKLNPSPTQEEILHFHQFTGDGDMHNDLLMNRDGKVFTVSITSIVLTENEVTMDYLDVKNNQRTSGQLKFESSIAAR